MKKKKLTENENRFIDEYLIDLNATKAAIRAGYSVTSARSQGCTMKKRPHVAREIVERLEARKERTKIDADWVLKYLSEMAEGDIRDAFDDDGNLKSIKDMPEHVARMITSLDVDETTHCSELFTKTKKLRLESRLKLIEMIGKHIDVQAFKEKIEQENKPDEKTQSSIESVMNKIDSLKKQVAKKGKKQS